MGIIFRALSSVAHQFISFVFKSDVLLCFTTTYFVTKHQTWKGTGHLDRPLHGCDDDYRESGALSWSNTSEWISNKQCTDHISTANAYAHTSFTSCLPSGNPFAPWELLQIFDTLAGAAGRAVASRVVSGGISSSTDRDRW